MSPEAASLLASKVGSAKRLSLSSRDSRPAELPQAASFAFARPRLEKPQLEGKATIRAKMPKMKRVATGAAQALLLMMEKTCENPSGPKAWAKLIQNRTRSIKVIKVSFILHVDCFSSMKSRSKRKACHRSVVLSSHQVTAASISRHEIAQGPKQTTSCICVCACRYDPICRCICNVNMPLLHTWMLGMVIFELKNTQK